MRDFKKLAAWEKAHRLTLNIYGVSSGFPAEEAYGLVSQLTRAASSIPTNIAEGCGRDSDAELARFLRIAMGSGNEVEYLLFLSRDLGYISVNEYEALTSDVLEVKRMLSGFLQRLQAPGRKPGIQREGGG